MFKVSIYGENSVVCAIKINKKRTHMFCIDQSNIEIPGTKIFLKTTGKRNIDFIDAILNISDAIKKQFNNIEWSVIIEHMIDFNDHQKEYLKLKGS